MKPRRPDLPGDAAWLGVIAPAALYLAAAALVKRGALWAAAGAGLPAARLDAMASAVAVILLTPAALCWNRNDLKGKPVCAQSRSKARMAMTALSSVAAGLLLGLAALLAASALGVSVESDAALSGPGWLRALRLVALCAAGPVCEETVYRGLVFRRGETLLGAPGATLVSAALFAAAHGLSARTVLDFLAGLAFAGVMLGQRRSCPGQWPLLAPILCHAAANAALIAGTLLHCS